MPRLHLRLAAVAVALASTLAPALAAAEIAVRFIEGAPTDRFEILNDSPCDPGGVRLEIDLAGARAGLYVDATAGGVGLQVSQPFRLVEGADLLTAADPVRDGDRLIGLNLSALPTGRRLAFTLDLDDELEQSDRGRTQISGAEISGAGFRLMRGSDILAEGVFGSDALARGPLRDCGEIS